MNEESIKVGDMFKFDLQTSEDKELADTLLYRGVLHGQKIEVTEIDDAMITFEPAIYRMFRANLDWFAEVTDSGILVYLGSKGAEPKNNDGRDACYWCDGPTTAMSAKKHFCKVCGK